METVSFRPEIVDWWRLLQELPPRLGAVHRWRAADHPPRGSGLHQHHTVTMVLCLAGAVRIAHPADRIDLSAGDALLVEAGAWHHHAPLRSGCVAFGQGFMGGRSDWIMHSAGLELVSSVPTEPSLGQLERALALDDGSGRQRLLAEHLRGFLTERSQPISADHRAYPAMELALWDNLHRRGTVAAMVRASGLSRAQAYRIFTACSGTAPAQAVRRERLALARRLLGDGTGAATVAERCGFPGIRAMRRALASPLDRPRGRPP